jgi:hypothetical protein
MHEGDDGSSQFIFDLMEPERPKIDRAVLDFVKGHVFAPAEPTHAGPFGIRRGLLMVRQLADEKRAKFAGARSQPSPR